MSISRAPVGVIADALFFEIVEAASIIVFLTTDN